MIQNLKLLLSLRTWLKSGTLSVAGILGILAGLDLATPLPVIQTVLGFVVQTFHVSAETAVAWLVVLKSLADAILRAKTEWSLAEKVQGKDSDAQLKMLALIGIVFTFCALSPRPSQAQAPPLPPPTDNTFRVTLSWMAPTRNVDGSPLTNLASYQLYFAQNAAGAWGVPVTIPAANTSHVLSSDTLQANTQYFFVLRACNVLGACSVFSNVAGSMTPDVREPDAPRDVAVTITFAAAIR
jgi:hypothetical protein